MPPGNFEQIVSTFYEPLYRFAFSLTRSETDARDLTQQTFYVWATKGHQLREASKVKSWLFTTLHREFLDALKKGTRFQHFELEEMDHELPNIPPDTLIGFDAARAVELLGQVKEPYRAALTLFYMEDYSYKEIAGILEIPIGTVQSRICRGLALLQHAFITTEGLTPSDESSELEPMRYPLRNTSIPSNANMMGADNRTAQIEPSLN